MGEQRCCGGAPNLFKRIAKSVQEILVCRNDRAIQIELDDGLRAIQRIDLSLRIITSTTAEHFMCSN
jgi:hypothetical protein